MVEEKKTRGRPKGSSNKNKLKYHVEVYDILNEEWKDGGNFASYYEIGEKYKYSYDNIRDIKNGRSGKLANFFKISLNR